MFTDGNCNTAPVKIDTTAEPNANIPNLAVGDVFNAGDYEVTVSSLQKGSQTLGWTGEGMVEQNLIAGVKIPMSVVFENIKINSCYQYYNRGENGAVVRSKTDESWGSVVSVGEIISTLQQSLTNLEDVLKNFSGVASDVEQLKTLNKQLEEIYLSIIKVEEYTDDGKDAIRKKIAEIKYENEELISNPNLCDLNGVNSLSKNSPNLRIFSQRCPIDDISLNILSIKTILDEDAKLQCHTTRRGISPWTISFEEDSRKDYLNSIKDGQLAHFMIERYYKLFNQNSEIEFAIPQSSSSSKRTVNGKRITGYADIVNKATGEIFEIKTRNGEAEGASEVELYVKAGNKFCPPISGSWRKGTNFSMPKIPWARDFRKVLSAKVSFVTPGVIIYQLEDNIDDIEPLLDPISTTTVKSIELMLKLMASASSITMAEQIARQHMKNFPPEVLEKIIFGAAAGVIAGVATSFSGVGTPTGITAIIACTIIVDIAFEQLNNSTDGNS